jgi:hypothetical protein
MYQQGAYEKEIWCIESWFWYTPCRYRCRCGRGRIVTSIWSGLTFWKCAPPQNIRPFFDPKCGMCYQKLRGALRHCATSQVTILPMPPRCCNDRRSIALNLQKIFFFVSILHLAILHLCSSDSGGSIVSLGVAMYQISVLASYWLLHTYNSTLISRLSDSSCRYQ